jgi:protoporphyrinogen oxidase
MDSVDYLVVGAGVSGLSFANWMLAASRREVLVIEADEQPGGYCKTVTQDGFVWDYSGHFFHFRHPEIEAWLRSRMPGQVVHTVARRALIRFRGRNIDFPFQKNIHQLPREDFINCLVDLYFRDQADGTGEPSSFEDMLYRRYGKSIAQLFLIPYNEKLYACRLNTLDRDAMGRFFPHADLNDVIRNMRSPDNRGYNATFTYPAGGAIEYVNALLRDLGPDQVVCGERLLTIDLAQRVAHTSRRPIRFGHLVSSAPLNRLVAACGLDHDARLFRWNQVLVFNLGFDRKGARDVHWMYFPDPARRFYRVGWYDNLLASERMSLYVEIGARADERLEIERERQRVLSDLRAEGIIDGHQLVSWHSVVLDPAYVHVSAAAVDQRDRLRDQLRQHRVYSVGRYGGWTYCSIEDNLLETQALARSLVG